MKFKIIHETKGRLRLQAPQCNMTLEEADQLETYISRLPGVRQATVHERTCNMIVCFTGDRLDVIEGIRAFKYDYTAMERSTLENSSRSLNRCYQDRLASLILGRIARKLLLPVPLRNIRTTVHSVRYIWCGLRCVLSKRLEVEVLDALSIGVSILRRDFGTAGSVMFLLKLGELLEEWTRKKSLSDLARCMSLNVDRVWLKTGDSEVLVPVSDIKTGDLICVHTGNVIPLDGRITEGEACVNQASLTGESIAVRKSEGSVVYYAEVLPADKARFVTQEKAAGKKVIMIGDGINDAPALSAADVGIAISDGAAIAREIADITIAADDLFELATLKEISNALLGRINGNYRFVLGFNGTLIVLGIFGVLPPATSALLHNISTLGISVRSMTNLLR